MRTPLVMILAADAHKWGKPEPFTRNDAFSVKDLCEWAGIPCRAFGHYADLKMIAMIDSSDNFLKIEDDGPFYSVGRRSISESNQADIALRVLEIMAYTFKEYSARECLNGQRLFIAPHNSYRKPKSSSSPSCNA